MGLSKNTMILFFALLAFPSVGFGGAGCVEKPLDPESLANASRMGVRVFETLERSGADMAILGRVGSDLSKYGLHFSHAGFAVREHPKGKWTVIHCLNQCGTDSSSLYDEGLINFFLDSPFRYEIIIAVPVRGLRQKLLEELRGDLVWRVHQPKYNMIAHPESSEFQNSNQWLSEFLIAVMGNANHRGEVHEHPLMKQYQPDVIAIDRMTRIGGGLFSANTTFGDHPFKDRLAGKYKVVTVRSVIRFLHRYDALEQIRVFDSESDTRSFAKEDFDRVIGKL